MGWKDLMKNVTDGEKFCNSNHVICKENGEPYRPKSFTSKWSKKLKKYGLHP